MSTTTITTSRLSPSPALSRGSWLSATSHHPPQSASPLTLSIEDEALLLNPLNLGTDEDEEVWDGGAVGLGFGFAHAQWSSLNGKTSQKPHKTCPVDELDFTCNICFETADDPCVTRCGHVFCVRDLRSWLKSKSSPRPASCPVCKVPCIFERDVVSIFDRAGKRPVYQPSCHSPGDQSSASSCPTPRWRPSTFQPPTQPSTPPIGTTGVPLPRASSPTPPPTSTDVTPRQSVPPSASRPKAVVKDDSRPLPQISKKRQKKIAMAYAHPLDAQQAYFEPCSRVFSLIALAIVVTIILK